MINFDFSAFIFILQEKITVKAVIYTINRSNMGKAFILYKEK